MYKTVNQLADKYQISKDTVRRIIREIKADSAGRYEPYSVVVVGNRPRVEDASFRYALVYRKAIKKGYDPRGNK